MRTFAVVMYPPQIDSALLEAHAQILEGGSIGQVFKERGWMITKQTIYIGELSATPDYAGFFKRMGGITPSKLAIYIYRFQVERDDTAAFKRYPYATIAEVYHPDYLTVEELHRLYQSATSNSIVTDEVAEIVERVTKVMASY